MSNNESWLSTSMFYSTSTTSEEILTSTGWPDDDFGAGLHDVTTRKLSLLETNPSMAVPYVALVVLALTVGVVGHSMILVAYIIDSRLRILGNEFLVNLAIADLCVTGIADPMCILGVTQGEGFFDRYPWLCEWVASLCLTACYCAFFSISLTTVSRYIFICHNATFYRLFTRRRIACACVLIWLAALIVEMPNYLHAEGHYFDPKSHQCIWNRMASRAYTMVVCIVLIICPLVLNVIGYLAIFIHIYRSKRRVFAHSLNARMSKDTKKMQWRMTLRATRATCIILGIFLVCWTPYAVVLLADHTDQLSLSVHIWVTFLAHLHSVCNVFVYAQTHPHFRETFGKLFGWRRALCCKACVRDSAALTDRPVSTKETKLDVPLEEGPDGANSPDASPSVQEDVSVVSIPAA